MVVLLLISNPHHTRRTGENRNPTAPWSTYLQLVRWRSWLGRGRR